eukprot:3424354-Rhodomonas_salina.2
MTGRSTKVTDAWDECSDGNAFSRQPSEPEKKQGKRAALKQGLMNAMSRSAAREVGWASEKSVGSLEEKVLEQAPAPPAEPRRFPLTQFSRRKDPQAHGDTSESDQSSETAWPKMLGKTKSRMAWASQIQSQILSDSVGNNPLWPGNRSPAPASPMLQNSSPADHARGSGSGIVGLARTVSEQETEDAEDPQTSPQIAPPQHTRAGAASPFNRERRSSFSRIESPRSGSQAGSPFNRERRRASFSRLEAPGSLIGPLSPLVAPPSRQASTGNPFEVPGLSPLGLQAV